MAPTPPPPNLRGMGAPLTALLLGLALPDLGMAWLAPLALCPLALELRTRGTRASLALAFLAGGLFQAYLHRWAVPYTGPGWILLVSLKALPFLVLAGAAGERFTPLRFAAAWSLVEWLGSLGPYGHDGGCLALAFYEYPVWLQSLAFVGPWLLGFLLAYTAAALSCWERGPLVAALIAWSALGLFGQLRLREPVSAGVAVAVVQNAMDHRLKALGEAGDRLAASLFQLTTEAAAEAEVVVWPESSFPKGGGLRWNALWSMRFGRLARQSQCWLFASSLEPKDGHYVNTTHLISPEGSFVGSYTKQRLVPFVEYLPWEERLREYSIFDQVQKLIPGEAHGLLEVGGRPWGILVCWESMNGRLARSKVSDGAQALVVTTNDEWFGTSNVPTLHLAMGVFRAVENGRPLVQAANTGLSAVVDPRGRILVRSRWWERAVLKASIGPTGDSTFYTRFGDGFIWLALVAFIFPRREGSQTP